MSRRKQSKPQHLKTGGDEIRNGLRDDGGRCPRGLRLFLLGLLPLLEQKLDFLLEAFITKNTFK